MPEKLKLRMRNLCKPAMIHSKRDLLLQSSAL